MSSGASVVLLAVLSLLFATAPAAAEPAPPDDEASAAEQLERVQREAEALTEEWHAAKDTLAARQQELETLQGAAEQARAEVDAARAEEEKFRVEVDAMTMAAFESGNLDQLNALLASGSPQEFLDQMSALETMALDYREALDQLLAIVDDTERKQAEADAAAARAQAAADEAERLLDRLTPDERRERRGPEVDGPSGPITGSGVGVEALRAAMTKLGQPYKWGAEGPSRFDCSGLVSWAFKQVGVTLPRSSRQQAHVGTPVSRSELRPGDLVFFYQPVSHVGIYVGDGKMINAPQTGDVVSYSSITSRELTSARRL
jgi:cell wall-associated NlpC family hydrolase